jgi:hypothetical protein
MPDSSEGAAPRSTRQNATAPAVIVHGLDGALAAVRAADPARGLVLLSAPGAGLYAGAGWFAALARKATAARPGLGVLAVLDCADAPGAALAALRAGLPAIVFTGTDAMAATLAGIAETRAARVLRAAPPALDLAVLRAGDPRWQRRLAAWLARPTG